MQIVELIKKIESELDRLQISGKYHAYSGLVVRDIDIQDTVEILDDYASGLYKVNCLIGTLASLQPSEVSLDSESYDNIWQHIANCEV